MSSASSDLRIPKQAVAVEVALDGEAPRGVELYLAAQRAHDPRPEDVRALLEAGAAFLPARDAAGAFVLARDAIVWIAIAAGDDLELYDERHDVHLELRGGAALDGELLYSPPAGQGRVVDHLNGPERFVRLFTPERVYLVAKAHVVRVVEKEA
jgi:hypothetical protein